MKKSKLIMIIAILIILVIIVGLFKIINSKNTSETSNSLNYVLEKGTLVLGLDDSFPPMGFRDENNEIVGFDIDVAKEVCERLDVELVLQPISWAAKMQELDSKNIDCIWNGMSINEERKIAMNLSESYMKNSMVLVVLADSEYNSSYSLKNKKIGVQTGSTAQEILEESNFYNEIEEAIGYSENITAFMDLEIGQIEAVFVDEVLANYYITSRNKEYVVLKDKMAEEEYAIGFKKEDKELRDKVQKVLEEMKRDGSLGEISTKWFGKDVTIIKVGD